ncbi:hypothetical protein BGW41_007229 [Actinomortierella wolfii]|nr:hypothetical protein BGW41_007229 [Actinomortierella wolfii]
MRDNPPKNKILVVGRRGVGKLSLVHAILGSRFIPTTSASRSRPASPLLLPVTTIPSLEESQSFDGPSRHLRYGTSGGDGHQHSNDPGNTQPTEETIDGAADGETPQQSTATTKTTSRSKLDHSGVTIPWTIDTKYYTVKVDFWIDETDPKGRRELERMINAGDLDEIGAVVEAVVFCFSKNDPSTFHDIKPWVHFVERMEPAITLCVATDAPKQSESDAGATEKAEIPDEDEDPTVDEEVTDYDDWCLSNGFEYVDLQEDTEGLGADEHVGLDRVLEALAAHMWDGLKRKSNKKQGQHTRNMIRSFSVDPDGNESSSAMDLSAILGSQSQSHISREYLEKLASMTQQEYEHRLDHIHEDGEQLDDEEEEEEDDDDDDDEDDEDDDRAFYRALAELSLHNRPPSPLTSTSFQREHRSYDADVDDEDTTGEDPWALQHSDDLGADVSHAQLTASTSSSHRRRPRPISNRNSVTMQDLLAQDQERQAEYFLNVPFVEPSQGEDEDNGEERHGYENDIRRHDIDDPELESEFSLQADDRFEFGDYISAPAVESRDAGFENDFMDDPTFGGISQEMVEEMHQTLFGSMDDEDGMARTLETLRGLREQGKSMSDKDRRELAARVALSFGMQMDK